MSILIKEIRIRNYKCYEKMDIKLNNSNIIIGANNAGKTSLLEAIELCFIPFKKLKDEIIFIKKNEILDINKQIIIDVLIEPIEEKFEDIWHQFLGNFIIESEKKDYIAIRTTIEFNLVTEEYVIERKALNLWPNSEEVLSFSNFNTNKIRNNFLEAFPVFYLDAKRDIVSDMNDKFSYWGKLVKDIDISEDFLKGIEEQLNKINGEIMENSEVLNHLELHLNEINTILNFNNIKTEINAVPKKVKDLNNGMELRINDEYLESQSFSNNGMGTRSWATFLTLSAYIEWKLMQMKKKGSPFHPIILLEEPEAHLHPQAQMKVYNHVKKLNGQTIVTTHSPIITSQAEIKNIIHIAKKNESSYTNYINIDNLQNKEIRKIKEHVLKTRGEILFSNAIILYEGETEDQVLPKFFKEFFNCEPFELGVTIIEVGGHGNYKPFITIAKNLNIDVFIFSDGEEKVIKSVKKQFNEIYDNISDEELHNYITFLPLESNFEAFLFDSGYKKELFECIDKIKNKENYIEIFIKKNQGNIDKEIKTGKICDNCSQTIVIKQLKDYSDSEGEKKAINDFLSNNKTAYSEIIGNLILKRTGKDRIPSLIQSFFLKIANKKNFKINEFFIDNKE